MIHDSTWKTLSPAALKLQTKRKLSEIIFTYELGAAACPPCALHEAVCTGSGEKHCYCCDKKY